MLLIVYSVADNNTHTLLQSLDLLLVVLGLGLQQLFHQNSTPVKGLWRAARRISPRKTAPIHD